MRDIRQIEMAMGKPEKSLAPAEVPVRARLGKSVVAAQHILAGSVISADMLTAKSPGDGIPANQLERLVGRVAPFEVQRRQVAADRGAELEAGGVARALTRGSLTDPRIRVQERARAVRLLCVDVDGVLTDAGMYYGPTARS